MALFDDGSGRCRRQHTRRRKKPGFRRAFLIGAAPLVLLDGKPRWRWNLASAKDIAWAPDWRRLLKDGFGMEGAMCGLTRRAMLGAVSALPFTRVARAQEAGWRPMAGFDPSKRVLVHDALNDEVIDWEPELYQQHYERYAAPEFDKDKGITEWDGLLLDRWKPLTLR